MDAQLVLLVLSLLYFTGNSERENGAAAVERGLIVTSVAFISPFIEEYRSFVCLSIFSCSSHRFPWQSSLETSVVSSVEDQCQAFSVHIRVEFVPLSAPTTHLCFMKFAKNPWDWPSAPPEQVEHLEPYGLITTTDSEAETISPLVSTSSYNYL